MRVLIYNEFMHEQKVGSAAQRMYPKGIHMAIAEGLQKLDPDLSFQYATLENHRDTLTEEALAETDVLIWWGHMHHQDVEDAVVSRVCEAVNKGMGLIVLHSGHESKVFQRLMGTRCSVHWRESNENGHIWLLDETHPIVQGVQNPLDLSAEETYAEPFDIPQPDELLGVTWWKGGEIFRGMNLYRRGRGKIFYFHPGHETLPSYYNEQVLRVIDNALHYLQPVCRVQELTSRYKVPQEKDICEALFEEKEGKLRYKGYESAHEWKAVRTNTEEEAR
ncbi:MAG: trehalose utilization protein ThuA [Lachnospiraceae bacterium]|jgi:trehalose utilization protein|nr:trehalose utilization protein ThuA [Lachnospiraceae bacterium]